MRACPRTFEERKVFMDESGARVCGWNDVVD